MSATFAYDTSGQLDAATYTDPATGQVVQRVDARDDKGRAQIEEYASATGGVSTDTTTYNSADQGEET